MKITFHSAIHLIHEAAWGSLATHSTQAPGYPFATVLPFAPDEQHCPMFLISGLAEHTKNLIADYRASLLIHSRDSQNVLTTERISRALRLGAGWAASAVVTRQHGDYVVRMTLRDPAREDA